ncbi:hypothetical protein [Verminephrobacter eiseniae]|uniref:hypothetical protein n=1 Tax=Verminephrobacter eiseniae TaxID=364317 RepID=UPI00223743BC|nr:hypothetical protein [Verminephrobacter eiseniae]
MDIRIIDPDPRHDGADRPRGAAAPGTRSMALSPKVGLVFSASRDALTPWTDGS